MKIRQYLINSRELIYWKIISFSIINIVDENEALLTKHDKYFRSERKLGGKIASSIVKAASKYIKNRLNFF